MRCPKCSSDMVNVQIVTESKGKSSCCLSVLLFWFVSIIVGIIALFVPVREKVRTHTEAVCQVCGHRWRVSKAEVRRNNRNA